MKRIEKIFVFSLGLFFIASLPAVVIYSTYIGFKDGRVKGTFFDKIDLSHLVTLIITSAIVAYLHSGVFENFSLGAMIIAGVALVISSYLSGLLTARRKS